MEQFLLEQVLQEEELFAGEGLLLRMAKVDISFLTRRLRQTGQGGFLAEAAWHSSAKTREHLAHSNSYSGKATNLQVGRRPAQGGRLFRPDYNIGPFRCQSERLAQGGGFALF